MMIKLLLIVRYKFGYMVPNKTQECTLRNFANGQAWPLDLCILL